MITAAMIVPTEVCQLLAKSPHMQGITVSVERRRPVRDSYAPALLTIDDSPEGATLDIGFHARCSVGVGAHPRHGNAPVGVRASGPRVAVIGLIEHVCMVYCVDAQLSENAMNRARRPERKKAFEAEMGVRRDGMAALTVLAGKVRAAWPSTVNDD